jgi:tetratricopeptide (TPR) repeat protein
VHLLDPETGQEFATLEDTSIQRASWLAFTPDGCKLVVVGDSARAVQIWDLQRIRAGLAQRGLDWDLPALAASRIEEHREFKIDEAARLYVDRAIWHEQSNRLDKALADYRSALAQEPPLAVASNNLAWLYVTAPPPLCDPAAALSLALQAVDREPNNWDYHNTLGVTYYRLGKWERALDVLQPAARAKDRGSSAAWDLYFMAMSYQRLGKTDKARNCYDQALELEHKSQLRPDQVAELQKFRSEAESVLGLNPVPADKKG